MSITKSPRKMQVAWRPGRAVEEDISAEEAVE